MRGVVTTDTKEIARHSKHAGALIHFGAKFWDGNHVVLPLDSIDSNCHHLRCYQGYVSKDGRIFVSDFYLKHIDHSTIERGGWFEFVRNTALRSFSQQGVD